MFRIRISRQGVVGAHEARRVRHIGRKQIARALQRMRQLFHADRFLQEIHGPGAQRVDHRLFRLMDGHHNDRAWHMSGSKRLGQGQAGAFRKERIGQHDIRGRELDGRERRAWVGRRDHGESAVLQVF